MEEGTRNIGVLSAYGRHRPFSVSLRLGAGSYRIVGFPDVCE